MHNQKFFISLKVALKVADCSPVLLEVLCTLPTECHRQTHGASLSSHSAAAFVGGLLAGDVRAVSATLLYSHTTQFCQLIDIRNIL